MFELIVGFIIGWLCAIAYLSVAVKDTIERLTKIERGSQKSGVPTYFVEEHDSILYVWDGENTFVTQGATLDALIADVDERLKVSKAVFVTANELLFVSNGSVFAKRPRKNEK